MEIVKVNNVIKDFSIPKNAGSSFWDKFRSFIKEKTEVKRAVNNLSFTINEGEIVGFLGMNGAGKSTTIKMLTGILTPTSGEIEVLGYVPWKERYNYCYNFGLVLGQKSLLWWDIPVMDSLLLYKEIYEISDMQFKIKLDVLSNMLNIKNLLHIPVRKLSLGERMKAEITASLLHSPKIIFLDEPTIGLDVLSREEFKIFIKKLNKDENTTIFLTTHNMLDVEELCDRILILDNGGKIFDGSLTDIKKLEDYKIIEFEYSHITDKASLDNILLTKTEILDQKNNGYTVKTSLSNSIEVVNAIMASCITTSINIIPPSLSSIISKLYLKYNYFKEA